MNYENYYGHWRIFYADGSTFTGENDQQMSDAPKIGVVAINQLVDGARRTMSHHDFYWPMGKEWCGGDRHGADMSLMRPGKQLLLFGQNVNTHVFLQIMSLAHKDPDFPTVSRAA